MKQLNHRKQLFAALGFLAFAILFLVGGAAESSDFRLNQAAIGIVISIGCMVVSYLGMQDCDRKMAVLRRRMVRLRKSKQAA